MDASLAHQASPDRRPGRFDQPAPKPASPSQASTGPNKLATISGKKRQKESVERSGRKKRQKEAAERSGRKKR
jgi:hypothetical protein